MINAKKSKTPDLNRRDALKRLGLAVSAAYVAPVVLSLSDARASSGSSGGGSGGSGGGGGGGAGGGSSSGGASSTSMASASMASAGSMPSTASTASGPSNGCVMGLLGGSC